MSTGSIRKTTAAVVLLLVAAACVPPATPGVDTLGLGDIGSWSAPDSSISAQQIATDRPRSGSTRSLSIAAQLGGGEVGRFSLDIRNVAGGLPDVGTGTYFGQGGSGHDQTFTVMSPSMSPPFAITWLGVLTIDEIEYGPTDYVGESRVSEVTKLRATYWAVFPDPIGFTAGALTIG